MKRREYLNQKTSQCAAFAIIVGARAQDDQRIEYQSIDGQASRSARSRERNAPL